VNRAEKQQKVRELLRIASALDEQTDADFMLDVLARAPLADQHAALAAVVDVVSDATLDVFVEIAIDGLAVLSEYVAEHATADERNAVARGVA